MRVVSTYSIKGGVGKTAAAVNLAYMAAHRRGRTLLWDLDPQGAASFYYRIKSKVKGGGEGLLSGRRPLESAIKGTDFPFLDLVPSDFSYRHLDLLLDRRKKRTRSLRRLLKPLRGQYDTVIIDSPPGLTLVAENLFDTIDTLVVPLIPTTLSVRTLDQLENFLDPGPSLLMFFSMVDGRKKLHHDVMDDIRGSRRGVLDTVIPAATEVELMGVNRAPVGEFAPGSGAAQAYASLWSEIASR